MSDDRNPWVRDGARVFLWPYCIVPGCNSRCCLRLNSERCYPHMLPGVPLPAIESETGSAPKAFT